MPPLAPWRPVAHRPPELVLHVSLPLEWDMIAPRTAYATDLASRMPQLVSAVPTVWSQHLAGVLLRLERAGRVTAQAVDRCLAHVYPFQIVIDPDGPAVAWTAVLALARSSRLTLDDAAYLELALRLNLPLATTAPSLLAAAPAAGVAVFTP